MSKLQNKKIHQLQAELNDFNERLEFKCFDCEAQTRKGPGWDCEMPNCPFYEIRSKTVYYKSSIPQKFWPSVFSEQDRKPIK